MVLGGMGERGRGMGVLAIVLGGYFDSHYTFK